MSEPKKHNEYIPGLSFSDYRNIGRDKNILTVNASVLKKPTALEMWRELNRQDEGETSLALAQGDVLHKAVLEPDAFHQYFDDFYFMSPTATITGKKASEAMLVNPGKIIYNDEILKNVEGMVKAIERHHLAQDMLNNCTYKELSGIAYDDEFGILRKIRIDAAQAIHGHDERSFLCDLKSTRCITYSAFRREIITRGYHMAAAYYLDTDAMITGRPVRENFFFIAVQNCQPYMARVYGLLPEDIEVGRELYKERLGILTQAYADNQFCAYEHESTPIPIALNLTPQK